MVIYFSGTGNSRYVAERIAEGIYDNALDLFAKLKSGDRTPMESDRPWVVVAPVYAWRLPRFLNDWLKEVELKGNKQIYFVLTCGDSVGSAAKYADRLAKKKDMEFMGLSKVVMPENYIALYDAPEDSEACETVTRAEPSLYSIIERIYDGHTIETVYEPLRNLKSGIVNSCFYGFIVKDRKFTAGDKCNGCGLCEKLCPLNNIAIENGKPRWKGNCTHCMACICHCPQEAIEYGMHSNGLVRYKFKPEFARRVSRPDK